MGISGNSISRISTEPLDGTVVVDAAGKVVAPGFIDLHQHGQTVEEYRLKALDGVTTGLELEIGAHDVARFLDERRGKALINFGSSASHPSARVMAFGAALVPDAIVPQAGAATSDPASAGQINEMRSRLEHGLDAGALGIGMGLAYTPGATRLEVVEMFRIAAAHAVPVFVHVRSAGRLEPGSSVESIMEVIAASDVTGAPVHIVHINSSGLGDAAECLKIVAGARARGLDVTTEGYPYGAGQTLINSALFNPGWRERLGVDYGALQLVETGERLTRESFDRLHAAPEPKAVLLFVNSDEVVDTVMLNPLVMVASDGGGGHPRKAGTFARVLRRYVREQGRLTLMDAVRKMTLMPAHRLERFAPAARKKGRLQEGADADVVVFDPTGVTDRATYEKPDESSIGFTHVLVSGTLVVRDGKVVENVAPGRQLTSASR